MANRIMFIDTVTTSNTAGNGHDCPVEFAFKIVDLDTCDDESKGQIKHFRITPDEKIMPGARVYSHLPAEIKDGNEISKSLMTIRELIKKAADEGFYLASFYMESLLKILRSNMERVLSSSDNGMIDTEEFINFPANRMISIGSLAKLLLPPEEVGTSYSFEALYLHLCGEDAYKATRKEFDEGAPRTVYNTKMSLGILKKLCEKKGFNSCEEIVTYMAGELGKRFDFGKYSGQLVEDVFKKDFGYCLWCFKNKELMDGHQALGAELFRLMKQNKKI